MTQAEKCRALDQAAALVELVASTLDGGTTFCSRCRRPQLKRPELKTLRDKLDGARNRIATVRQQIAKM